MHNFGQLHVWSSEPIPSESAALSSQNLRSYCGSTVEPFLKQKRLKMVQVPQDQKWSRFEDSVVLSEVVLFWFL